MTALQAAYRTAMIEYSTASAVLLDHIRSHTSPTEAERNRASGAKVLLEAARRAYLDELRKL